MAYDLLRSAKHIRGLSDGEFRVLFYLLEAANNETYECFPSLKKIASFTDMADRTVQRHITSLAKRGLFERIEQRRNDGSRAVNCYRFTAAGTIKIGRESVIQLGPETETDGEHQPANSGGLNNRPILTPPPDKSDTTPRQDCRDIDQESEPGIRTSPPFPDGKGTPAEGDLFGVPPSPPARSLSAHVEKLWAGLKEEFPRIAAARSIDDSLRKTIELRGKQHAREGEDAFAVWDELVQNIRDSRFLCGLVKPGQGRDTPFKLSLGWATKTTNFREILHGTYNRDRDPTLFDENGRRLGPGGEALGAAISRLRSARERGRAGGNPGGHDAHVS